MQSTDQLISLCNAVPDQQPLTTACLSEHPLLLMMVLRTRNAVARLPLPWPRCSTTTHPWLGQVQHYDSSVAGASPLAGAGAALQLILGWDRCICWGWCSTTTHPWLRQQQHCSPFLAGTGVYAGAGAFGWDRCSTITHPSLLGQQQADMLHKLLHTFVSGVGVWLLLAATAWHTVAICQLRCCTVAAVPACGTHDLSQIVCTSCQVS